MEIGDSNEGEVLTGAELFYYLSKRNKDQLDDCRRKLGEYTRLVDILQSITDRCHVPILAPVASGAAYFEAKIEYTNNILVLLGDNWFAERSAKQAREIAERRLEFLRGEENALLAEECALAQRQELFFSEFPNAEKAMAEVEAAKQAAFESRSKKCTRESTCAVQVQASQASVGVSPQTKANESLTSSGPEPSAMAAQPSLTTSLGPDDQELAVFDELDELTEEELLEIERELGDRIDDDELAERLMTERLIAKKEKRIRGELERKRSVVQNRCHESNTVLAADCSKAEQLLSCCDQAALPPLGSRIESPGDIGRLAAAVVANSVAEGDAPRCDVKSKGLEHRVKFSDVVSVVPPEVMPRVAEKTDSAAFVLRDVVERQEMRSVPPAISVGDTTSAPKKKSLFREQLDGSKN